jgi:PAS domain S-box-containing protein
VLARAAVVVMITVASARRSERSVEEERLRAIFDTAQDGIVIADGLGRIVAFNRAAERSFGLPAAQILGEPLTVLMPERFHEGHEAGLRRFLETGERRVIGRTLELAGKRGDGEEFPLELSLASFEVGGDVFFTGIVTDITARKRSERALEVSERRFRTLVAQAPVGILESDPAGECLFVNEFWCELTGMSGERAAGTGWAAAIHPNDRERVISEWYDTARRGERYEGEHRYLAADGGVGWAHMTSALLSDESGATVGHIASWLDVTERKRGEEAARRLAAILNQTRDAVLAKSTYGIITEWNRAAERLYGYTAEEAVGQPIGLIIPEKRTDEQVKILERILAGQPFEHYETVRRRRDGSLVEVAVTITPIRDEHGRIVGASSIARDISRRKREERYRAVRHEASRIMLGIESAQQAAAQVTRTLGERLGWQVVSVWMVDERSERIRCETMWHDPTLEASRFAAAMREAVFPIGVGLAGRVWATRVAAWIEDVLDDPNFPRATAVAEAGLRAAVAVPVRRGNDVVGAIELVGRDIQRRDDVLIDLLQSIGDQVGQFLHRKQAEARIGELAELLDLAHDAIIVREPNESRVVYWNREAEEIYGYAAGKALGRVTHQLLATTFPEPLATIDATLRGRGVWEGELTHTRSDGRRITVASRQAIQRDEQGEPKAIIEINSDISRRKRIEQQRAAYRTRLQASNAELEQFAYVASHDLQEPLRSITGFVQLLERRYHGQLDEDADRFIRFTVDGVARMQALINDVLSFSRAGADELRRKQVDVSELVERTVSSLDAAVRPAGAQIDVAPLPTITADRRILVQVFQNLLSNALKFTGDRPPHIEVSAAREDGAWCFTVADEGIGIDPHQTERVFRMFQRLHARDEYAGNGIGLAISKRIVERHGGSIWCEPRPAGGTAFRFTIPDSEETPT